MGGEKIKARTAETDRPEKISEKLQRKLGRDNRRKEKNWVKELVELRAGNRGRDKNESVRNIKYVVDLPGNSDIVGNIPKQRERQRQQR